MNIRLLDKEDWVDFKAIRLEALLNHPEAFGSSFEEESNRSPDDWKAGFKTADIFGCFVENNLVACAGFFVLSSLKMRHRGVLFTMYIKPTYRKKGIGDALVKAVISRAEKQVSQLHLTVVTTNKTAIKLYEKNGFRIYGTEPHALKIGGSFYDEHMMVLAFSSSTANVC